MPPSAIDRMSLFTYGALYDEHLKRQPKDKAADDGAPVPTARDFAALREQLRGMNLPNTKV